MNCPICKFTMDLEIHAKGSLFKCYRCRVALSPDDPLLEAEEIDCPLCHRRMRAMYHKGRITLSCSYKKCGLTIKETEPE